LGLLKRFLNEGHVVSTDHTGKDRVAVHLVEDSPLELPVEVVQVLGLGLELDVTLLTEVERVFLGITHADVDAVPESAVIREISEHAPNAHLILIAQIEQRHRIAGALSGTKVVERDALGNDVAVLVIVGPLDAAIERPAGNCAHHAIVAIGHRIADGIILTVQ